MLALYRSGRQADALDAYRRARERLVEDLGLDPGRELQRLEAAILGQDPALDLAAAPAPAPAPVAPPELPALPVPPTPLLGREDDLATAAALLAQPHVRLLTLTGPAGIGKTRLALELAHRTAGVFAHGAVLVPLAAVGDPARVPAEIGEALGAPDGDLTAALARRELLLVIDNFEHLLAAAPDLGALLATSPGSKLVVTSRAALRLAGEHELAVPPLPAAASAELFLGRARALDPRLALSAEDRESVERICARLDGLPLAIELAAARTKVLSPPAILSRLERRLDLLSAGPRDAPARQQTLRAAIGWSCDLLDPEAQALFARVGVFVGGWTLETAEAVCGPHALDGIAALVDHSLVTRTDGRFGMLETVRELALERLAESGELPAVRRRHAEALLERFAGAESGVLTGAQRGWLDGLDADRENVRAAIAFAVAEGDAALALGLCAAAWRYWERRGHVAEGRATLESGLALPGGPDSARMVAHNGAGVLAGEQADLPGARAHFEAALELAQALGDGARAARIGGNLGSIALYERDYPEAIRRYTEAMERAEDPRSRSLWLQNAGLAHEASGDRARGLELVRESIGLAREAGDPSHLSSTLRTLARLELHDDAAELDGPLALVHESLELSRQLSERHALAELLETLGGIARRRGDPRTGAVLIAAAAASRGAAGAIRAPDEDPWVQREEAALRAALGGEAYAAAVADGARLTLAEATTLSEEV
jgi:predicted ATPase